MLHFWLLSWLIIKSINRILLSVWPKKKKKKQNIIVPKIISHSRVIVSLPPVRGRYLFWLLLDLNLNTILYFVEWWFTGLLWFAMVVYRFILAYEWWFPQIWKYPLNYLAAYNFVVIQWLCDMLEDKSAICLDTIQDRKVNN